MKAVWYPLLSFGKSLQMSRYPSSEGKDNSSSCNKLLTQETRRNPSLVLKKERHIKTCLLYNFSSLDTVIRNDWVAYSLPFFENIQQCSCS